MAQVQYSANVMLPGDVEVHVHTMFYQGQWQWFGSVHHVVGLDERGIKVYEHIQGVDCGGARYESSAAAIAAAVAQVGGAREDWGLASVEDVAR